MWAVFKLQWVRLRREPILALSFLALTFLFVFFLAGSQADQKITIQTFSDDLPEQELTTWLSSLNNNDTFFFQKNDREEIVERISSGQVAFAVRLEQDQYHYIIGQQSHYQWAVDQHVQRVYSETLQLRDAEVQLGENNLKQLMNEMRTQPLMELNTTSLSGDRSQGDAERFQVVIGMTLYFVIYTLLANITNIVIEKRRGTWNRVILSPVKKTKVYLGQLLYCFVLGFLQIMLSFILFQLVLGYDFGANIGAIIVVISAYVFAIVALGMLVMGIVQSPQQLQSINPIVATGMAMLGGAFWPIDIISNQIMVFLSKTVPIYYGMEGLKGAILYDQGIVELSQPITILILMGVIFMGIGLNLMERGIKI